ncbi:magnesium transporter NIPA-domain-containing protein [Mycena maculata]|uniref:Magnesium transporter NIPA-domain-containing protein n=1 Tax=Mycena maculata TaxID=230809 RepID=A0AAD7IIG3_9AGAR|nr:magnesium transporter NIPA-domain-containing protein [Mycena maculata]
MATPLTACYPELDAPAIPPWRYTPDIGGKLPELNTGTVIGITVAITGNVLISLALNLQKLAHKRGADKLKQRRALKPVANGHGASHPNGISEAEEYPQELPDGAPPVEAALLVRDYGTTTRSSSSSMTVAPKKTLLSRLFRSKQQRATNGVASERTTLLPVDVITEEQVVGGRRPTRKPEDEEQDFEDGNESDYLKSKIWWLGFALMNIGELGNFISYAWAPASVVAPLGTFALMANCVFAPLMLGERFRKRDIFGILIAVVGAVTVVLASNASDTRLDPDALLLAISQTPFIVYSCTYLVGIIVLSLLSEGSAGKQWVFVDVGLCALFGGFTVLSTKAVSTLLTMEWFEMFTKWITYPTIAVLVVTGVGQIRYLNRALMRFDGKVVIPIQFVLFTMSAIVGSAILYGDFKKATFHQLVTFLYGCAATFTGVFIIAWEPNQEAPEDEQLSPTDDPSDPDVNQSEEEAEGPALGPPGRRKRPTLVLPSGVREHQLLHKQSAVSMLTLSPARPLLLVHTPPREVPDRFRERDPERDGQTPLSGSQRRRAISYMDDTRPRTATAGRNGSMGRSSLSSAGLPRSDDSTATATTPTSNSQDDRR